jgi:hypothetical protein
MKGRECLHWLWNYHLKESVSGVWYVFCTSCHCCQQKYSCVCWLISLSDNRYLNIGWEIFPNSSSKKLGFTLHLHTQLHIFCISTFLKSKDCERKGNHLVLKCIYLNTWTWTFVMWAKHHIFSTWSTPSHLCSTWKTSLTCHFHIHTRTTFKSADWPPRNNATEGHPSSNGLVSEQQDYQIGSIFVPWCKATLYDCL